MAIVKNGVPPEGRRRGRRRGRSSVASTLRVVTGLDWIAFNVECAIGQRSAPLERAALAHELVPELLAELPRRIAVALGIGETLAP